MPQVNLSLNELYEKLCPQCKEAMIAAIKDKMTDQAIRQTLEGKTKEKEEE